MPNFSRLALFFKQNLSCCLLLGLAGLWQFNQHERAPGEPGIGSRNALFFNRLINKSPPSVFNRMPEQCAECLSTDIIRMHLTRLDRERHIQRRYQCRACDHNILVTECEELDSSPEHKRIDEGGLRACTNTAASADEMSDYERKVAALQSQLALIDQEIDQSQRAAERQETELMRASLGVADLKGMDAVTVKHSRLLTLLNDLHRMHYSKELVLAETEHEKDQLRLQLAALQARYAELESVLKAQLESANNAREAVVRENQILKQRVRSLENTLRGSADTPVEGVETRARFIDTKSANTDLDEPAELPPSANESSDVSELGSQADDTLSIANKKYRLGVRFIKGDGVKQSEKTAIARFEQAAVLGHAAAQHNLGVLQYKGSQHVRDLKASVYWLSLAAQQGHEKAVSLLPEVQAAYEMYEQQNIAL